MSKLEDKLLENKSRLEHEKFINDLNGSLKELFISCEKTSRPDAIKNLASPIWENGELSISRDNISNWKRNEYETWEEVSREFIKVKIPKDHIGWLSFNFKGMHYQMSGEIFSKNIKNILSLLKIDKDWYTNLSWIGENEDFGIVFEHNHHDYKYDFELYYWGI